MTTWSGPVAVVTGAGAGIGAAAARLYLDRGYAVVAADISQDALAWCAGDERVATVVGDISEEPANKAMIDTALDRFGSVDAVVLNAGIARKAAWEADDALDVYDRVMAINARGVVLGIRCAAPVMARQAVNNEGGGAIVVIASTSGVRADPDRWIYNASKAAAINIARAASLDWASRGVRVNVVGPGPTLTPILASGKVTPEYIERMTNPIPMKRLGKPEEQAEAIFFLTSPAASFITGAVLMCDGGTTANVGLFPPPNAEKD